jgi:hypothetical protein
MLASRSPRSPFLTRNRASAVAAGARRVAERVDQRQPAALRRALLPHGLHEPVDAAASAEPLQGVEGRPAGLLEPAVHERGQGDAGVAALHRMLAADVEEQLDRRELALGRALADELLDLLRRALPADLHQRLADRLRDAGVLLLLQHVDEVVGRLAGAEKAQVDRRAPSHVRTALLEVPGQAHDEDLLAGERMRFGSRASGSSWRSSR